MSNIDPVKTARGAVETGKMQLTPWQLLGYYGPGAAFMGFGSIFGYFFIVEKIDGNKSMAVFLLLLLAAVFFLIGLSSILNRVQQLKFTVKETTLDFERIKQAVLKIMANRKLRQFKEDKDFMMFQTFRTKGSEGEIITVVHKFGKLYVCSIYNPADSNKISMGSHNEENIKLILDAVGEAEKGL